MTDLRKAAEQAATDLEELIHWHGVRDSNDKLMPAHNQTPEIKSAIESLEALRQALAQPEPTVEDNSQNWKGMDGAVAWHLIDRHADNWADIGKMMDEWLKANQAQPEQEPVTGMFEEKLPDQNPPPWVRDYKAEEKT